MKFEALKHTLQQKGYDFSRPHVPYAFSVRDFVRRYDTVFRTPMKAAFEALPVGNGDLGAMVWTDAEHVTMQLNKSDLWTKATSESGMLLRSAGRLCLDFGMPLFDYLYLEDFEARLSMADEEARIQTVTPFAKAAVTAYADPDRNLLISEISCETPGPAALRIALERYGSRAFPSWYAIMNGDASIGLGQAQAGVTDSAIWLYETFDEGETLSCAIAAKVVGVCAATDTVNGRRAELTVKTEGSSSFVLLTAVVSSHESDTPLESALAMLDRAAEALTAIRERKAAWWEDYWNRSFVYLTKPGGEEDFDYLAHLYYMQQYMMGIGSRGEYPLTFNGGIFTWNHDVRQWVNPHHWNMQQAYWSVEPSNRPELAEPYLKTYFRMLPRLRARAAERFHVQNGAVLSEAHDFAGNVMGYDATLTPLPQVAMHFWDHYCFGGNSDSGSDETFLRETAYPLISACADMYAEMAVFNEATGQYDIGPVTPYETDDDRLFYNTCVDGVMARYIFRIAGEAADILGIRDAHTERWKTVSEKLFDFRYVYRAWEVTSSFKGHILALGETEDRQAIVPSTQSFVRSAAPMMPCAIIGQKDRGSMLYQAVENAVSTYVPYRLAHLPAACIHARLGHGEQAVSTLFDMIDQLQHFPQGLFYNLDHWSMYSRYVDSGPTLREPGLHYPFSQRDYMYDFQCSYKGVSCQRNGTIHAIDTPTQPFVQCGFEAAGILAHTYQELAMQSHEGFIRLYPAFIKEDYCGAFTLKACGGFLVSGAYAPGGTCPFVCIRALRKTECRILLPFAHGQVAAEDGTPIVFTQDKDGIVSFAAEAGGRYFLWADGITEDDIPDMHIPQRQNNDERQYRNARIGAKRQY